MHLVAFGDSNQEGPMLFDPKDGPIEVEKPVTYGDVYVYCQHMMGTISMLNIRMGRHNILGGEAPTEEAQRVHIALKDAACELLEHIERESGCLPREMDEQLLEAPLTAEAKTLYDIMIERQHELQRLIGEPEGPVPVCI